MLLLVEDKICASSVILAQRNMNFYLPIINLTSIYCGLHMMLRSTSNSSSG